MLNTHFLSIMIFLINWFNNNGFNLVDSNFIVITVLCFILLRTSTKPSIKYIDQ